MSAPAPGQGAVIPIGALVPLTGASASDGQEFRNGVVLAVEEINARGGLLGRPLAAHFADTGAQTAEEVTTAARRLVEVHGVHAIVNGYNIGAQNAEYEVVADAEILYIHHNTLLQHHDTIIGDPHRYFGCFMSCPADYWYGQGFIKFISWLRDTGQWVPPSNRIAIVSGPKPYSIVVSNAIAAAARQFNWEVASGPHIVKMGNMDWQRSLALVRDCEPAIVANTHFYAADLARFQMRFMEDPFPALMYLQYGALHQSFRDVVGQQAAGVLVSTMIGLPRDAMGDAFARRYLARFGSEATPQVGCQSYVALHHYAIAASLAGGTGAPGEGAQNRRVASCLRNTIYRSVSGAICYHPQWQAAVPYPDHVQDPSLGLPHLFYQVDEAGRSLNLIAPEPYAPQRFFLPLWMAGARRR